MSKLGGATIVVAGAINTDLVATVAHAPEAGETVTGDAFAVFGGGKAANQAVAASRAGESAAVVGAVGDDAFGADRLRDLVADTIDVGAVAKIPGMASGVALITVERAGENRIAYVPSPTLKVTGEQIADALRRHRPAVYLQPNEVPIDAAAVAFRTTQELGATTILNAAPDPETVGPLLSDVDYLIANEGEAFAILGKRDSLEAAARVLAVEHGLRVVLTAGAAGAYCADAGETFHVPAPRVDVVDTTGAGDTFCGALAACIARGLVFREAVTWAVHAGALAATVAGAQPSIPHREAVDAFLAAGTSNEAGAG